MKKQEFTCIVFFHESVKFTPSKYRKIYNLDNFMKFAKTLNGLYVNVYHKETKEFYKQIKV